jgi:hypothetical protein
VQALLRELKIEAPEYSSADLDGDAGAQDTPLACIAKLRSAVIRIRNSPQRRHELRQEQREADSTSKKELILDTRTRWNSTHDMLKRACELRGPLSNVMQANEIPMLSDDEWSLIEVSACPVM